MIGSLKYFDMIWNMTQGGPAKGTELMATYMYKLSKSGLSTLAIYNGVSMWNEFAFANTLLLSANQKRCPWRWVSSRGNTSWICR